MITNRNLYRKSDATKELKAAQMKLRGYLRGFCSLMQQRDSA